MKKKRKTSLFSVVVLRVIIVVLSLWLFLMSLFTWAVAKDFYLQLESSTWQWASLSYNSSNPERQLLSLARKMDYGFSLYPNTELLLPILYDLHGSSYGSDDWFWGKWELMYGYQAAIQIDDDKLNIHLRSGDYIFFEDNNQNCYYIDLSQVEGGKDFADAHFTNSPYGDSFAAILSSNITFTGYADGHQFYPISIRSEYIHQNFPESNREQPLLTLTSPEGAGRVTYNYDPGEPFRWHGKTYQNAGELLDVKDLETGFGLLGSVIFVKTRYDTGVATAAVYCNPLEQAMLRTWHIWLITGAAVSLFLIMYLRKVQRDITLPLRIANQQYAFNDKTLDISLNSGILELDLLGIHFQEAQLDRHDAHNRIQQLETALNYAKEAEENRRRLISALAHELKTPLAVIHGYAEGLQEGIAEDKKAHYLSVLLEESERMDGMVKEMLDYSRLEAGKVTLDTEKFSLTEMTTQVFERLKHSAQQRQLAVEFVQAEEFTVTADKSRIRQVITNLADNAIKYTTHNGCIRVMVYKKYGSAYFVIENDCDPLPQNALEHIWDSFYRVDTARSSVGTGLGLAIVKSIVNLHRGSCYVQNTKDGVRFSFSIPM